MRDSILNPNSLERKYKFVRRELMVLPETMDLGLVHWVLSPVSCALVTGLWILVGTGLGVLVLMFCVLGFGSWLSTGHWGLGLGLVTCFGGWVLGLVVWVQVFGSWLSSGVWVLGIVLWVLGFDLGSEPCILNCSLVCFWLLGTGS
jgi:hypothetical protein